MNHNPQNRHSAAEPQPAALSSVRAAAAVCTACPLYKKATQTVFGEGPEDAAVVLVGEQPGDSEDREGRPFVGSAGQVLDRSLADAEIDRATCYVTNAVKHFKWEPNGKRRLHKKPSAREIAACRPWLAAELSIIRPKVLICLGATALRSVFGRGIQVLRHRGEVLASEFCEQTLVTVHPSSLLRMPDPALRESSYALFVGDLRIAATLLKG